MQTQDRKRQLPKFKALKRCPIVLDNKLQHPKHCLLIIVLEANRLQAHTDKLALIMTSLIKSDNQSTHTTRPSSKPSNKRYTSSLRKGSSISMTRILIPSQERVIRQESHRNGLRDLNLAFCPIIHLLMEQHQVIKSLLRFQVLNIKCMIKTKSINFKEEILQ